MKIMFFSQFASGHNIEYLHHYYQMAFKMPKHQFYFIVPEQFRQDSSSLNWPFVPNISFEYIDDKEYLCYIAQTSAYKRSYILSRLLNKYVKKYNPDKVMLTVIMPLMPFLPILVRKKNLITGIIYKIYLHERNTATWKTKIADWIKYTLFSKMSSFERLFILNDQKSSKELCQLYSSSRFSVLPDPYVPVSCTINIRKEYNIQVEDIVFAHIGDLTSRKGTLDILKSIKKISKYQKQKYVFFFAGRVNPDIRQHFYEMYKDLIKTGYRVFVNDAFCSFDFFGSLCEACNAILIPYHGTSQSSGILGYASQFGKPVIAPNTGIIGKLVNGYKLGVCINEITTEELLKAYVQIEKKVFTVDSQYCKDNNVDKFQQALINDWIKSDNRM